MNCKRKKIRNPSSKINNLAKEKTSFNHVLSYDDFSNIPVRTQNNEKINDKGNNS